MMTGKRFFSAVSGIVLLANPAAAARGDRGAALVDLAACDLRVTQAEVVLELALTSGAMLTATDNKNRLLALTVSGVAAAGGQILLNPRLFGATTRAEGDPIVSVAKAVGYRMTDQKGEIEEIWTDHDGNALVLTVDQAGEELRFMLAFEIPKKAKVLQLSVPALQEAEVRIAE